MNIAHTRFFKWIAAGALSAAAVLGATSASARDLAVSVGIHVPGVAIGIASPVHYAPAPVYYDPPPRRYRPAPAYDYHRPAPRHFHRHEYRNEYRHGHRHQSRHHRHDRHDRHDRYRY
jgi:hypothetical protein